MKFIFKIIRYIALVKRKRAVSLQLHYYQVLYENRFNADVSIKAGQSFSIFLDASNSKIFLGKNLQFKDYCQLRSGNNGVLQIGNDVFFNNCCSVNCLRSIKIGNNCQFGEGVKFYDHNHMHKECNDFVSREEYAVGAIKIGNNCWIGSNVVILKNVTVGDNVIIGAGCVIHKSIPDSSIVLNHQNLVIKPR